MLARCSLLPVLIAFSMCIWVKTSITPIKTWYKPYAAHRGLFWTHHMCHMDTLLPFHARAQLFSACFTCVFNPFSVMYMSKNKYLPYQNLFQPVRSPLCAVLNWSHVSCGHSVIVSCSRAALYCVFFICVFISFSVVYMTKKGITTIKTCSNLYAAHHMVFWTHLMYHTSALLSFHARA